MWKAVLAGTTALAIAGSTLAFAQRGDRPDSVRRGDSSIEEMQAFANARLAALRAGLNLTPEQQVFWPAVEQAARDLQALRTARVQAAEQRLPNDVQRQDAAQNIDPAERLRQVGNAMADSGAALKKLADAVDPLYRSLDDSQKRRFTALGRMSDPREFFASRGGDDRGFREREERDGRGDRSGGRDFRGERFGRREFRDGSRERFSGRDYHDGARFFRDGPGFRGERDRRDHRFGRGDDFRGRRDFRGGGDDREYRGRDEGPRGFRGERGGYEGGDRDFARGRGHGFRMTPYDRDDDELGAFFRRRIGRDD